MERNPTDNLGTSGAGASSLGAGTDSISVTGAGAGQDTSTGAYAGTSSDMDAGTSGAGGSFSTGASTGGTGMSDRLGQAKSTATDALSNARGMAGERLGQAKEKATALKSTLADRLERGANTLRQQAQNGGGAALAGAGVDGGSTAGLMNNDQMQRLAGPAADAMQRTAEFLRDGDLKASLEEQVRTNPARTLLIALGVGYLLGKAVRR